MVWGEKYFGFRHFQIPSEIFSKGNKCWFTVFMLEFVKVIFAHWFLESDHHIFSSFWNKRFNYWSYMLDEIRIKVLKSLYHTHYYRGRGLYSYIINSYLSCKNPLKLFCEEHVKDGTCKLNKNYPFSIYEIWYLHYRY